MLPLVESTRKRSRELWSLVLCVCLTAFRYIFVILRLPAAERSDTVCDNTNTSFCHCHRANRLIGLPCYPTQTLTPKESTQHFHNVIDRVLRCNTAWKYTPRDICMSITSVSTWGEESQFKALLHIQQTPNHPNPHKPRHTTIMARSGKQGILGYRK